MTMMIYNFFHSKPQIKNTHALSQNNIKLRSNNIEEEGDDDEKVYGIPQIFFNAKCCSASERIRFSDFN